MSLKVEHYMVQVDTSSPLYGYLAWDSQRGGNATPFNRKEGRDAYEQKIQDLSEGADDYKEWEDNINLDDLPGILCIYFHGEWEEDRFWAENVLDYEYEDLMSRDIWEKLEDVAANIF